MKHTHKSCHVSFLAAVLAASLLWVPSAFALCRLYAIDASFSPDVDGLFALDSVTGDATLIGPMQSSDASLKIGATTSLATHPVTGALFAWDNTGSLVEIDGATGEVLWWGALNTYSASALTFTADGRLFAMSTNVIEVDLVTGLFSGSGFFLGGGRIAESADVDASGTIYALTTDNEVLTIDPDTQTVTVVGSIGPAFLSTRSIAFDDGDNLIGKARDSLLGAVLFDIDKATGAASNVRAVTVGTGNLGAIESCAPGNPNPVDLIEDLESILDLDLPKGTEKSLLAKLDAALANLLDGNEQNDGAVCNVLEAFINAVEAQRGKKIDEADADVLIAAAQAIIDLLCKDNPGEDMGTPIAINFDPQTLVSEVLVEVLDAWLGNPDVVLHIEITGLNGGSAHHGTDDILVSDTNVFFTNGTTAQTVVDWTADTAPQHVNEVYTVCVQILENGVPVGAEKCQQFGPF